MLMRVVGTFELPRIRKQRWRALELQAPWRRNYPQLFDSDDLRLATGPQGKSGYGLVEWLGAILLHNLTGYNALVAKYQFRNHPRKREIVGRLGLSPLLRRGRQEFRGTQGPDLLMFAPDFSGFYFCEIKGPGDTLKPLQERYFQFLEYETGDQVRLLRFRWAPTNSAGA
jgi:hypothetical protein